MNTNNLSEEEIKKIIEEYGDISNYIKDETLEYKKKTVSFLDAIKILFFVSLIKGASSKEFNEESDKLLKKYEKTTTIQSNKGYLTISSVVNYINKSKYTIPIEKVVKTDLKGILEQFEIDLKSVKSNDLKFITTIKKYYATSYETLRKDFVNKEAYLSKKVDTYDKVEKIVRYSNGNYYDISSYDSMVYNTNLTNTGIRKTIEFCEDYGEDIVYVPGHPFSCPLCSDYQGKFYSLSGKTQIYKGNLIRPYESAIYWNGGGLNHPNCSHIPQPVNSSQEIDNSYSTGEWEERYQAKQKKQSLELQRSRLKSDNKIYAELGNQEAIDKNNSKIRKLNEEIKEQKKLIK